MLFTVHGHQFSVSQEDLGLLQAKTEVRTVDDDQLAIFLQESKDILRPSVYAIFSLFLSYLEQKGRYEIT